MCICKTIRFASEGRKLIQNSQWPGVVLTCRNSILNRDGTTQPEPFQEALKSTKCPTAGSRTLIFASEFPTNPIKKRELEKAEAAKREIHQDNQRH
jgi:hypothetical protein